MTARLQRLTERRGELVAALHQAARMNQWQTVRKLEAKIKEADAAIEEAKAYEPMPLSKLLSREEFNREGFCEEIIKIHMAADFLTDVAMAFRCHLEKKGLVGASLFPEIKKLEDIAAHLAAVVCKPEYGQLSDFMTTNDSLIDGMHKLCDDYLAKHLNIV